MQSVNQTVVQSKLPENEYFQLYTELKAYVESYGGGLAALAQKVSISKPTLWRWINFKNSKAPNPYHVLSLMKFITKKDLIVDIANTVGGEISNYLELSFAADFEAPPTFLQLDINTVLDDFYCYFVYLLCGTAKPMTRDEVRLAIGTYSLEQLDMSIDDEQYSRDILIRLGQVADLKIQKLIDNQVIKEVNGHLVCLMPGAKIKIATTKKHLPRLYSFFKEKNMHKFTNLMYAYQESIPRETIKQIINLQYDTFMKCYQLMEKNKCADGEVYLLSTFFENFSYK